MEMTLEDKAYHATWRPASGHKGGWRVCRQFFAPFVPPPGQPHFQEGNGASGKLRLFKTQAAAQRAADEMNAAELANNPAA